MNIHIQSSSDLAYFNRLINHPQISPYVRDDRFEGAIDCTPLANDPANVFLHILVDGRDAGFAIMISKGGNEYEMHSGLLPEFRGRVCVEIGLRVIDWMHDFGADRLTTWAWESARHVRLMARMIGFEETSRENWPWTVNGLPVRRVCYAINYVAPLKNLTPNLEKFISPCL